MTKQSQRRLARDKRASLSSSKRQEASQIITSQIILRPEYITSECVLSYSSFSDEVDTMQLNQQILNDGKKLFLPRTDMNNHKIVFYQITDLSKLTPGYQGILEPFGYEPTYHKCSNSLMIIPGLAFDCFCNRMGYGGGYYDRYLDKYYDGVKMQIAFSIQEQDEVITDENDKKMDLIITELDCYQQGKDR